jgi:hypothetical protein
VEKSERPDGITAIATVDFLLGMVFILLFALGLNFISLAVGIFFIGFGYGTWVGMSWAWYLLTFGGGFFGWYFAKNDVKEYFGIEDGGKEEKYTGD